MPQSLHQIYVHIVFSTKNRAPFLRDRMLRQKLHCYLNGCLKNLHSPAIVIGGVEDHVHVLCRQSKRMSVSELIREQKRESSKWIKRECPRLQKFRWQSGYGAFSISPSHIDRLKHYILNQETHHQKESFQEEFRRLCNKYSVSIDEKYVWD